MIELRFLVGALGERLGWWPSQFTSEIGIRRLAAVFPRTSLRAALESVVVAARRDHEERLHPGAIHLFRLGSTQEDMIAHHLAQDSANLAAPPTRLEDLLEALDALGPGDGSPPAVGPCSLGKSRRTRQHGAIADLARAYAAAARSGQRAIPYFEAET